MHVTRDWQDASSGYSVLAIAGNEHPKNGGGSAGNPARLRYRVAATRPATGDSDSLFLVEGRKFRHVLVPEGQRLWFRSEVSQMTLEIERQDITDLEFQPQDDTLTELADLDGTPGLVEQTGPDAFAIRALGMAAGTHVPTTADLAAHALASGEGHGAEVPARNGYFIDDNPTTNIWKFRDRVFFGDGALYTGRRTAPYGGSWLTENGASYFEKNSQVTVLADAVEHRYGLLAAGRSIGLAAVSVNDGTATVGRAIYAEAMHKGSALATAGIEVQAANYSSTDTVTTPYSAGGTAGIYLSCEGGVGYTVGNSNTPVAQPTYSPAAMFDLAGGSTSSTNAWARWNKGIVFRNGSLRRSIDGLTGDAVAIALADRHQIQWWASSTVIAAAIKAEFTAVASQDVGIKFSNNVVSLHETTEKPIANFIPDKAGAGSVNYFEIKNAGTGIPVRIGAVGADTDIDLSLVPKGTGVLRFGTLTASADAPVSGYITIKDSGGTTRKLAVIT